ncbi:MULTISPECIES: hypothetical protein [Psychromonas]|uniref:hypothetical protein n=1 Tax=Psychromonas TaxID=67572 RepID=UPI000401CDE4|nr:MULTISPECIES: hypothetical protein [Psychromonas]MBB1272346.1 hypothetical protein [Psychromonas sp. SR45-3]
MITVETPASFEWNESNSQWVKNYLIPKTPLLLSLTQGLGIDINNMSETQFKQLCQLLETTAEGRELRNKMFKAWRSKKSRDSDDGKKLYTFNLSIKAGDQLKKVAKNKALNKTLESLIFAAKESARDENKMQQKIDSLSVENDRLKQQLSETQNQASNGSDINNLESLIKNDLQVAELAKLEKSQLIKQILLLKRKLNK